MKNRNNDQALSDLQKTLYESKNPVRRWLHTSRRDLIIRLINNATLENIQSAIEVGPGSGVYIPTLCTRCEEVTALDVELSHLNAIAPFKKKYSNLSLVHKDLTEVGATSQYDLVVCSEVLEHVPNPALFVESLSISTKIGGVLILSTPQPFSIIELVCRIGLSKPLIKVVRKIYGEPVLPTGHISLTSRTRILELLSRNRYKVIESHVLGLYFPFLAEFGGETAVTILARIEKMMQIFGITWPMWTQVYVAVKEA